MPPSFRIAIYWAPPPASPLARLGAAWLGRDPETGARLPPLSPDIAAATTAPRRYGFHATLRNPVHPATGWDEFRDAAAAIAQRHQPFTLPPFRITELGDFLALTLATPSPELDALAASCIRGTNHLRMPPDQAERARRALLDLDPVEKTYLDTYGYPYVLDRWQCHLTLTNPLETAARSHLATLAQTHFAGTLDTAHHVTELALFTQATTQADFLVAERLPLG